MDKKAMVDVMKKCEVDLANEMTALEKAITDRGHIMLLSPNAHPELAGVGIDFCWGKAKYKFMRINDCEPQHLHDNIVQA